MKRDKNVEWRRVDAASIWGKGNADSRVQTV